MTKFQAGFAATPGEVRKSYYNGINSGILYFYDRGSSFLCLVIPLISSIAFI